MLKWKLLLKGFSYMKRYGRSQGIRSVTISCKLKKPCRAPAAMETLIVHFMLYQGSNILKSYWLWFCFYSERNLWDVFCIILWPWAKVICFDFLSMQGKSSETAKVAEPSVIFHIRCFLEVCNVQAISINTLTSFVLSIKLQPTFL